MKRALILLSTAALAGCSMAPKDVRPAAPVPPSWPAGDSYLRQSEATLPALNWHDVFRDARLQTLIEQALANNRDLRVAAANIAAARAQYRIQRGAQFPGVDASLGVTERRGTTTTVNNGTGTGTGGNTGGTGNAVGGNGLRTNYSTQVGITGFELDLFGRLASLTRVEQNTYFATEAGARATRLTLVGDIATAWLNYASDASLLQVAQQTAKSAEDSVRLTRARLEGGVAPRTDLRQAEQTLATAQNDVARQTTALAQDVNALRLLAGSEIDPALLPASIEQAAPGIATVPARFDHPAAPARRGAGRISAARRQRPDRRRPRRAVPANQPHHRTRLRQHRALQPVRRRCVQLAGRHHRQLFDLPRRRSPRDRAAERGPATGCRGEL
jgi:outer membrane protein, multidrug efflux system